MDGRRIVKPLAPRLRLSLRFLRLGVFSSSTTGAGGGGASTFSGGSGIRGLPIGLFWFGLTVVVDSQDGHEVSCSHVPVDFTQGTFPLEVLGRKHSL